MRAVLIIAVLVCLAALAGWVTFREDGDSASFSFDKQEAREDSREAIQDVEDAVDEIGDDIGDDIERQFDHDEPAVDVDVRDDEVDIDIQRNE